MSYALYINKPKGITSFDVCYKLRRVLNSKKIGHTGTLDPNATGVMIVLYNSSTKANQFLVSDSKEYICRVKLGIETDTLDIDGKIINKEDCKSPNKDVLVNTLNSFVGKQSQIVPITSAVKVNGKKLYEYQRNNIQVDLPCKDIEVHNIELIDMDEYSFTFKTKVSSGTYIRALARDILIKLNLIGTVEELTRTMIDDISVDECDDFNDVLEGNYHNHDLLDIMSRRYVTYDYEKINDVINGKRIKLEINADKVVIVHDNVLYAIYQKDGDMYKCLRGLL
ncbi:MAG: tRNA pseudouridine(55) synthase TruB [Erysipelotrichaceae bacterium]|nr:tRNA pseudouridine(55) synthase TruB [Erysipelotrichaceae bacterium]